MRDGFTEKYRRTLDLIAVGNGRLDAGTLLTFLRNHVEEHIEDARYPHVYHLSGDDVPPTAYISLSPSSLTLSWTEQDVDAYNAAIDAARAAKEKPADDLPAEMVSSGAADPV